MQKAWIGRSGLAPLRNAITRLAVPTFVGAAWFLLLVGCTVPKDDRVYSTGPAYFRVDDRGPKETFVIQLSDPAKIAAARAIVAGTEKSRVHVMGTVVSRAEAYNPPWHFHLAPQSITFFERAIEVCDATTTYVEEHLAEIGGAFLPNSRWCPWNSRVISEIEPPRG